jgi:beta-glucanase (GH16 family)
VPDGPVGGFSLVFDDEFSGSSLNLGSWVDHSGYVDQNNVTDSSSNLSVGGGDLVLTLASSSSGEAIETKSAALDVGDYAEARIDFAGDGASIYNWPAFWAAGPGWPASGEQDVFEGLGSATVNYHYAVDGVNTQAGPFYIPGVWSDGFHTYGVYRGSDYCDVYWDGQLVKSYPTDDDGDPEYLILEVGSGNTPAFGAQGQMVVDYVREWQQN